MMKIVVELERKLRSVDSGLAVICDSDGVILVICSQVGDGIEILTAADGERFLNRAKLLANGSSEIKPPVMIKTIK